MTIYTILSVILGIFMGVVISSWYMKRKTKKIINESLNSDVFKTLKSEGSGVDTNLPKREGKRNKGELKSAHAPSTKRAKKRSKK